MLVYQRVSPAKIWNIAMIWGRHLQLLQGLGIHVTDCILWRVNMWKKAKWGGLNPTHGKTWELDGIGCSLRRGVHAQTHCWMCILYCFFTVFSASRQCCPGGGGGEGGGQEQLFLRVMFSAFVHLHWFLQCFSLFRTFFFAPSAFSLGFYSVFRLHDVADATLHIGVGWGGAITFMWTWQITLLRLHHVADATGGMLTFHVTCSRCWCYATLGWGGC